MRAEYQIALCRGSDINKVCAELKEQAQRDYHKILASIEADRLGAELIRNALACPGSTEAHKMAHAYVADYRKQHEKKLTELDRLLNKLHSKLDDEDTVEDAVETALELGELDVLDSVKEVTENDGKDGTNESDDEPAT